MSRAPERRTLLRGGTLVTMNANREVFVGDLLIQDAHIARIERAIDLGDVDADVVDCRDRLVIPGLIQPHVHLCQTLFRGMADGLSLLEWLRSRIWPLEAALDPDDLFASATLASLELLASGTTSILDMGTVHHTDAIFEACRETGIRATIGKAMMDTGEGVPASLLEDAERSIRESADLAKRWHGREEGRLRYAFAPRFVLSCTDALLSAVAVEARRKGLIIHTHASENSTELDAVRRRTGRSNVEHLAALGMLGPGTVLAHGVWLSPEERRTLREAKTHVVHCPASNMKLGSGFARVPELLDGGINVGLAADGAACNNRLDAFAEMRLAALIHAPTFGPAALSPERVFEMATMNGARALGLERELGSLELGKRADVVVVDPKRHRATPSSPYAMLVFALDASHVEAVFVDGIARVRDGRLVGVDEGAVVERARRARAAVVQRAGLSA